ncbi:MAG: metal-dependent transcriptional regulator [Anaerolineae bacterium]|nr:metal-dependent transcriptional regulator [Anaerolineae bacterium]
MCPTVWLYLGEIYRLQEITPWVTLSMVADSMGVSLQAASRMIRRMVENGHIEHEPYRGVHLTPAGEIIALHVIRRHRIMEAFMVQVMGFGWEDVHEMVERLERGVDDRLIDRMFDMAGQPTRCPHGEPIPSADGVMPALNDKPLAEWPEQSEAQVSRVKTHDPEKLRYLASVRLVPGTSLLVRHRSPFNGPVHLECAGERLVLGNELASELYVQTPEKALA